MIGSLSELIHKRYPRLALNAQTCKGAPLLAWILQHWSLLLALCVAAIASYQAISFACVPILESFSFRQTQTALSVYWMVHEGWKLAYETPVVGYPWAIPFEFPIYQSLVALIAWLGSFPIDPVGRLVSFAFLLACAWPARALASNLKLPADCAWAFCALLWSSPFYLFWGRTFLIETTAVFFTLAALPYAVELMKPGVRLKPVLLCTVFFTLASLQKITTSAPVIAVMGVVILIAHLKSTGLKWPPLRQAFFTCLALLTPIILTLLWTHYTDTIKALNPTGQALTSKALQHWNFGDFSMRYDPNVLQLVFVDRIAANNVGGQLGLLLMVGALIFSRGQAAKLLWICLVLLVLPVLIFTNLHYIHDYYQTSCALYLIAALAIACTVWLPQYVKSDPKASAAVVTVMLVLINFYSYSLTYANTANTIKKEPFLRTIEVSNAIKRYTPQDSAIAVFGIDWSSEVAYYSERKAFTVAGWFKDMGNAWLKPESYLGGKVMSALVYCGGNPELLATRRDFYKNRRLLRVEDCAIWFPNLPPDLLDKRLPALPQYPALNSVNCGFNQYIDRVNGRNYIEHVADGLFSVKGWLAYDVKEGIPADETYVTLTDSSGNTQFLQTHSMERPDLSEVYQHPNLNKSGFETTVDAVDLKGTYTLGLARVYQGRLERCQNISAPIRFN